MSAVQITPATPALAIEFFEDPHWLGGSLYVDSLLAALSTLPAGSCPPVRIRWLSSPDTPLARRLAAHPVVRAERRQGRLAITLRRGCRALTRRVPRLGRWLDPAGPDLHFPVFDARQPWRRNLYWIPDFQPHHLPALFTPQELQLRMEAFAGIASARGVLLLSSQSALADFRRFYPQAVVTPRVWSFCSGITPVAGDAQQVLQRHGLPDRFVYLANQFWKHKDHATVIEALRLLRARGLQIPLVCTGLQQDRRDPGHMPALLQAIAAGGLSGQVHLLGMVPREAQVQLFRQAVAVLQPSRFEGWSTVIEDAKALGRPVIASDLPVHREQLVAQPSARLVPVGDLAAWAEALAAAWEALPAGPDLHGERAALARRDAMRRSSAEQFIRIIDEALGRAGASRDQRINQPCAESQV
jgi:glycosyltransferase involved in cell wall biosynthesis